MNMNLNLDLSDMQAWLIIFLLTELDYNYVYSKTQQQLPEAERRSNAESTLRAVRVLRDAIIQQGGYSL